MNPTFKISSRDATHLLEGLVKVNQAQIQRRKKKGTYRPFFILRSIQNGDLRYKKADPIEHWKSYEELHSSVTDEKMAGTIKGGADCEDLSAAVVAEFREEGIPARTYVYHARPKLYHVIVHTDRWGLLDPSITAGMKPFKPRKK
tara:strand:- start:84 stop:518 length:435 start_codon:yes stop_codon:yes gene_type:complete